MIFVVVAEWGFTNKIERCKVHTDCMVAMEACIFTSASAAVAMAMRRGVR